MYLTVPMDVSNDDAYLNQQNNPKNNLNKLVDMNIVVNNRHN